MLKKLKKAVEKTSEKTVEKTAEKTAEKIAVKNSEQLTVPRTQPISRPIEIQRRIGDDNSSLRLSPYGEFSPTSPKGSFSPSFSSPPLGTSPGSQTNDNISQEVWEDNIIKQIFNITLTDERAGSPPPIYLKSIADDLASPTLSESLVERIIITICGMELKSYSNPLEYFLKAFKIASEQRQRPSNAKKYG